MRAVDPARSRIVLAGTPAYDDPALPDVPAVANNLADLFQVLTDPDLGGFSTAHCVVAPARSSVPQIGEMLVNAANEAEDLLMFYFSGHGMLGPLRRELYLGLAATRPGMLAFTALPFDAVRDACLNSRATNRVVILDSCYSGRAIGETLAGDSESVLGQIQVAGTYTLASAPANRTALSLPGERNTAFTGRMLDLLRSGSASAGPLLSLGDIYRYLYTQLLAEGLPVPQQRGTETADLLGLVRNAFVTRTPGSTVPLVQPQPTHEPRTETQAGRDEFDVIIATLGDKKIQVIRVVRELTSLGLKEANDLVNAAPKPVLQRVTKQAADKAKAALEQAGATATVRSSRVQPYPVKASHTAPVVEPGRFDVMLKASGDKKIQVIQVVRELTSLGLKEANDLVNAAPKPVLQRVTKETADKAKAALEQTGAITDVRSSPVDPVRFDVILKASGDKKIQVIRVVRELTSLGLKQAKDLVDAAPNAVLRQVTKDAADKAKTALEQVGATATVLVAHRFASTES